MRSLVGQTLGKYEIIEEVGRGGFATVYKAVDTTLERLVALKVLAPHLTWDTTFVERFKEEARTAANLHHPSIVIIYEVAAVEDVHYIAMEYLDGSTLSTILVRKGALPLDQVVDIMEQLGSALDYTQASGLVHRDIKPSNVIVSGVGRATLTDFGIVKAAAGSRLTATGTIMGTPEYMSPEQVTGGDIGPASDIYSLAVVCYEMLSGRGPFSGTTASVLHAHVYEEPPFLQILMPDLPGGVGPVIHKALAKQPQDRYGTAGAFAEDLMAAVEGTLALPPSPPSKIEREASTMARPAVPQTAAESTVAVRQPAAEGAVAVPKVPVRTGSRMPKAAGLVVVGVVVVGAVYLATRGGSSGPGGQPGTVTPGSTSLTPPATRLSSTAMPPTAQAIWTGVPAVLTDTARPPSATSTERSDAPTSVPPSATPTATETPRPTEVPTDTPVPPTQTPVPPTQPPPTQPPPTQPPATQPPPTQPPPTQPPPTQPPPTTEPATPTPPPA